MSAAGDEREPAAALLALVSAEEGLSLARACKRLGLARSQLQRLLVALGADALGGQDLLEVRGDGARETLWLTPRARLVRCLQAPLATLGATRIAAGGALAIEETLAEETPVALLYNGEPHVVMMATPAQLDDFALGFSLSEGIVARAADVRLLDAAVRDTGVALHLGIPQAAGEALAQRQRHLTGRSGCGWCGAGSLDAAIAPVRRLEEVAPVAPARLLDGFARLEALQPWNRACGALHAAAALCGDELLVREDVGRHNALDKVIGALARASRRADALLVTSRASYELVHKTAQAGIGTLAAVSAPTALAVRLAREAGLQLYGFARGGRITRYA
jgi:formate dehydrogenase accessory protein FdhD